MRVWKLSEPFLCVDGWNSIRVLAAMEAVNIENTVEFVWKVPFCPKERSNFQ